MACATVFAIKHNTLRLIVPTLRANDVPISLILCFKNICTALTPYLYKHNICDKDLR